MLLYTHPFVCINSIEVWAINLQCLDTIWLDKELIQNFVVMVEQPKNKYIQDLFFNNINYILLNFKY